MCSGFEVENVPVREMRMSEKRRERHINEVFAKLVNAVFLGVLDIMRFGGIEEELKGLSEALSRIQVF